MFDFSQQLFVFFPCGLALVGVGLIFILAPKISWVGRVAIGGTGLSTALLAASLIADSAGLSSMAIAATIATLALVVAIRIGRPASARPASSLSARQSSLRWGVATAVLGAATLLATVIGYDVGLADKVFSNNYDLELVYHAPERVAYEELKILTDRGRVLTPWRIKSKMDDPELFALERRVLERFVLDPDCVRTADADESTNCHGWVFTGGRSIVHGGDVDLILADNGYRTVDEPLMGDLVVYRNGDDVSHTAIVRAVEADRVVVEGKWSWMGVFRHPVQSSMYGQQYAFYRAERVNHVVKIVDAQSTVYSGAE